MNREEAIAQLKDLIRDRKSFIENDDPNNVYRDDSGGSGATLSTKSFSNRGTTRHISVW